MLNSMRRNKLSSHLLRLTDGLLGTVTNVVLLQIYILASIGGVKTMGDANRMAEEVHAMFDTVNYDTIKRAIYELKRQGLLVRPKKEDRITLAITKLGKQRIEEIIPTYKTDRPWDGHIYLISYDIPKTANRSRDLLREYIRRTGGQLLQESLWVNPYNPTLILETFSQNRDIPGTILVSKLGTDGTIGDETLLELINRVYKLDELAQNYQEFLETYRKPEGVQKTKIALDYLSVLKKDPQLPFPLLPKDFPAEEAYRRYQILMRK